MAIMQRDVHIVGELCHCLRIFGASSADSVVAMGVRFLLDAQDPTDGSWPIRRSSDEEPYFRYHASMCATMALYEPVFRGFGPGSKELNGILSVWQAWDQTGPAGAGDAAGHLAERAARRVHRRA